MSQNYNTTTETPKLKIDTTITETKFVKKDIPLPYYFQDGSYICKVVTPEHFIQVDTDKDWWGVKVKPVKWNLDPISKGTQISEFEFEAAYQNALMYVDLICKNQEPSREADANEEIDQMRESA